MGISINTARAHRVRTLGDITVIFTWINDERAMVLLPTFRKGAPWFVVPDSVAYEYADPRHAAERAIKAAEVLDMPSQAYRLATIMQDGLEELVTMPSKPPAQMSRATFGQVRVREGGQEVGGQEIRLPVGEGVSYG